MRRSLSLAFALVAASFATTAALADAAATAATTCPALKGPTWSITARTGTKYALQTFGGYRCSTATTWAKKLAARKLSNTHPNSHSPIIGPAGFTCEASPDRKGHAFTGSCRKVNQKTKIVTGFDWTFSVF